LGQTNVTGRLRFMVERVLSILIDIFWSLGFAPSASAIFDASFFSSLNSLRSDLKLFPNIVAHAG
jgi:hypothetical protein